MSATASGQEEASLEGFCRILGFAIGDGKSIVQLPSPQLILKLLDDLSEYLAQSESEGLDFISFFEHIEDACPSYKALAPSSASKRVKILRQIATYLDLPLGKPRSARYDIDELLGGTRSEQSTKKDRFIDSLIDEVMAAQGKSLAADGLNALDGLYKIKRYRFSLEKFIASDGWSYLFVMGSCTIVRSHHLLKSFKRRGGLDAFCPMLRSMPESSATLSVLAKEVYLIDFAMVKNLLSDNYWDNLVFLIKWLKKAGAATNSSTSADSVCCDVVDFVRKILRWMMTEKQFGVLNCLYSVYEDSRLLKEVVGVLGCKKIRLAISNDPHADTDPSSTTRPGMLKIIEQAMADHEAWLVDLVELLTNFSSISNTSVDLPKCLAELSVSYL